MPNLAPPPPFLPPSLPPHPAVKLSSLLPQPCRGAPLAANAGGGWGGKAPPPPSLPSPPLRLYQASLKPFIRTVTKRRCPAPWPAPDDAGGAAPKTYWTRPGKRRLLPLLPLPPPPPPEMRAAPPRLEEPG